MKRLTLKDIWNFLVTSRKKIFLAGIIFMIAVIPAIYLLAPAKYNIQTTMTIPYEGVKVENYEVLIRREILGSVCRKLNIDLSAESMAEMDGHLSVAVDEVGKKIYLSYLGSDAEQVTAVGNEISMQTLKAARDERVVYLEEAIKVKEERIETIDELMDDEFIADYYERISREWRALLEKGSGAGLNIFLDVDPTIKNLYIERKNLKYEIKKLEQEITELRKQGDKELAKHFSPIYQPDEKEPPQLIPVILLSAVAGIIFGILWGAVINFGFKKRKGKEYKELE